MSLRQCEISLRRSRLEAVCAALSALNLPGVSLHHTPRTPLLEDGADGTLHLACEYPADHEKTVVEAVLASGRTPRPGELSIRLDYSEFPSARTDVRPVLEARAVLIS